MKQQRLVTPAAQQINPSGTKTVETEYFARPQTFTADIFVPLLQNLIGGLACGGLGAISAIAVGRWWDQPLATESLLIWCGLLGGFVACAATLVRFFGDDFGLVRMAYRRGRESSQGRIHALELELQQTRTELARVLGKSRSVPSTKAAQSAEQIYVAAQRLIRWHFEHLPIDRRSCEQRNMGQREWRRARQFLMAAGVMDESSITVSTPVEALARTKTHYLKALSLGEHTQSFVSPQ